MRTDHTSCKQITIIDEKMRTLTGEKHLKMGILLGAFRRFCDLQTGFAYLIFRQSLVNILWTGEYMS